MAGDNHSRLLRSALSALQDTCVHLYPPAILYSILSFQVKPDGRSPRARDVAQSLVSHIAREMVVVVVSVIACRIVKQTTRSSPSPPFLANRADECTHSSCGSDYTLGDKLYGAFVFTVTVHVRSGHTTCR